LSESKRKYLSEFAVGMYTARWIMIPASEINADKEIPLEVQNVLDTCHIYAISKMPSLSFCKDTFEYKNEIITGNLLYKINGEKKSLPFTKKFPLLDNATGVKISKYPHREIVTFNNDIQDIRHLPANLLCIGNRMPIKNKELRNLEVLYIGQAYGNMGNRSAVDRLKSHSTLQKILADVQHSSPDDEVYVLTFEYMPYQVITSMDGRSNAKIKDYRDIQRFHSILDNPLTEYQQICLIEAGLIRYFQPTYNKIYKDNFPAEKHKILEKCYELDFSGLIVEINTEELSFLLYSEIASPKSHHIAKIELTDPDERWGFFHFSVGENETMKTSDVISRSQG